MITTSNEFETIPAFTTIAGCSLGTWSQREIICDLVKALQTASSYDTCKLWRDIAECTDDDEYLMSEQQPIADLITEHCPLPDYCTIDLQDGEWLVMPYIDDELPRYDDIPDTLNIDNNIIVDATGELGPWQSKDWRDTLLLNGAARDAAQERLIKDYAIYHVLNFAANSSPIIDLNE